MIEEPDNWAWLDDDADPDETDDWAWVAAFIFVSAVAALTALILSPVKIAMALFAKENRNG